MYTTKAKRSNWQMDVLDFYFTFEELSEYWVSSVGPAGSAARYSEPTGAARRGRSVVEVALGVTIGV